MARTRIIPADVINSSAKASNVHSAVMNVALGISLTRGGVDGQILNSNGIGARLENARSQVEQLGNKIGTICQTVENGAILYQSTEANVIGMGRQILGVNAKQMGTEEKNPYEVYFESGIGKTKCGVAAWKDTVDEQNNCLRADDINNAYETLIKYLKKVGKSGLSVLEKAGTYGKMCGLPIALLNNLIDHDGISGKDIGTTIKGMGNTIIGMCDEYSKTEGKWPISTDDIKELAGLSKYKTISLESARAGWLGNLERAGNTAWKTLKTEISPKVNDIATDGTETLNKVKTSTKVAGWALSLIANGFSNYDEYNKKEISMERACVETVTETLVDIGKGALLSAGVAAGCAAIGIEAPVVVVGGIVVGASLVVDIACEHFSGKKATELVSDSIIDLAVEAKNIVGNVAQQTTNAISSWFNKTSFSILAIG